jgi:hypothetical protein
MQTAYSNFDDTVRSYLSKVFDSLGMNGNHSQIFTIIYDGIKGIMQNAMFYLEDALTEQNIFTATRKKSVYSLAKISGYDPYYGSAAAGTLIGTVIRGSALESDATKIFIPNGAVIINKETSRRYILQLSSNEHVIDLTKPLISHDFKIIEGVQQSNYYTATGEDFETVTIEFTQTLFDKNNVQVYVNGIEYSEAASMYDMTEGENEYVILVGYDGNFDVMFGNDIYGKKLQSGDSVTIKWISHNGEKGNVLGTSTSNFVFETTGRDTYGNDVNINLFMNLEMNNCISGGTNSDSIDTIRNMIGYNSRSLVLATEENFMLFLKRFSFIGKVNCWSHENSMQVIVACLSNKITDISTTDEYYALNVNDLYINSDQEEQILNTMSLSNRTFAGISVQFKNPVIWRYACVCIIKLADNYNKESMKEEIKDVVGEYFMDLKDNVEIIYKSDIIKTVLNEIDGLSSFDLQFISEKAETAFANNYYEVKNIVYNNGSLLESTSQVYYDANSTAGLDTYGNIIVESKLEIPLLQGGFNYYNKDGAESRNNPIKIETFQFIFI